MDDLFLVIKKSTETCGMVRHVFTTNIIPPADDLICECGTTTWGKEKERRLTEWINEREANE